LPITMAVREDGDVACEVAGPSCISTTVAFSSSF
jgi:hypothetical protein